MGGSPSAKKESNDERNARLLSARKSSRDAKALAQQSDFLRRARRRSSLFGGPETGKAAQTKLGGTPTPLGAMGA